MECSNQNQKDNGPSDEKHPNSTHTSSVEAASSTPVKTTVKSAKGSTVGAADLKTKGAQIVTKLKAKAASMMSTKTTQAANGNSAKPAMKKSANSALGKGVGVMRVANMSDFPGKASSSSSPSSKKKGSDKHSTSVANKPTPAPKKRKKIVIASEEEDTEPASDEDEDFAPDVEEEEASGEDEGDNEEVCEEEEEQPPPPKKKKGPPFKPADAERKPHKKQKASVYLQAARENPVMKEPCKPKKNNPKNKCHKTCETCGRIFTNYQTWYMHVRYFLFSFLIDVF